MLFGNFRVLHIEKRKGLKIPFFDQDKHLKKKLATNFTNLH